MSEKLITVIDASGDVGRHVVKALLESNFKVRALVCGLDDEIKQHAKVEVVDLKDQLLIEKSVIEEHLKNAYGCFAYTDRTAMDIDEEREQGKNIIQVCKDLEVDHLVIVGTQCDVSCDKASEDTKNSMEASIEDCGVAYTIVRAEPFAEIFIDAVLTKDDEDNTLKIELPTAAERFQLMCLGDFGKCIRAIFMDTAKHSGKTYGLQSFTTDLNKMVEDFNKVFNPEYNFKAKELTTKEVGPGGKHAACLCIKECAKCERQQPSAYGLDVTVPSLEQWLTENKDAVMAILKVKLQKSVSMDDAESVPTSTAPVDSVCALTTTEKKDLEKASEATETVTSPPAASESAESASVSAPPASASEASEPVTLAPVESATLPEASA